MDRRPKRIQHLIHRDSGVLGKLVDENNRRVALNKILEGFLDRPFAEHVQVASVRETELVLCADSPAWGHRVRYLTQAILDHFLANGLTGLTRVSIIVRSTRAEVVSAPTIRTGPSLSRHSARYLEQAAAALGDSDLAARLRAIARHETEPQSGC